MWGSVFSWRWELWLWPQHSPTAGPSPALQGLNTHIKSWFGCWALCHCSLWCFSLVKGCEWKGTWKSRGIPPRSKEELLWVAWTSFQPLLGSVTGLPRPPSCLVGRRSWFLFTLLGKHTFAVWFVIPGGCFCEWLRAPGFVPLKADCLWLESWGSVCRAKLWLRIFRSWGKQKDGGTYGKRSISKTVETQASQVG